MDAEDGSRFGYRLREVGGAWRWVAFDPAGRVTAEGWAPSRAVAAACVIRALAGDAVANEGQAEAPHRAA